MKKLLRSKVLATIMMMLILMVGTQGEIYAKNMMDREKSDYIIGSYRRDTSTAIAASRVTSITFDSSAPSGAVDSWDVSKTKDAGDVTAYIVPSTTNADGTENYALYLVSSDSHFAVSSGAHLFANYTNATSITNFNYLDLSGNTSAYAMFYNMKSIENLNLTTMNLSNITTMGWMFSGCENLKTLTFSSSNASNVANMEYFLNGCNNLTSLDLSSFGATKVTNMNKAFYNCSAMTTLNLTGFSTAELTNLTNIFYGCNAVTSLDLSGFNTKQITSMKGMFYSCYSLTTLNLSGFNTENVTTMEQMFYSCQKLTSLDLTSFNTSKVENFNQVFMYCYALESITFGNNFTTSNATALRDMFAACNALKAIDTSKIDTSKAETLEGMFKGCKAVTELDVSHFDTSSAKCMASMFDSCISLTVLDLSSFDTSSLDGVTGWYSWAGNSGQLVDTHAFLYGSTNLEVLILGPKFTRLDGKNYFYNTTNLKKIISLKNPTSTTDILSISDDNQLQYCTNATLYVPNTTAEGFYESNSTYVSALTKDRIKPILELKGKNPDRILKGRTYTDAGVTVAGFTDVSDYNKYELVLVTTGASVDTSSYGTKTITYTLKYTDPDGVESTFATESRTVNVEAATKNLMAREDTTYALGSTRAGLTQYTADLISKVVFTNVTPSTYEAFWDVSEYDGDGQVISYLVQSGSKYEQHIVASTEIIAPANSTNLFYNYTSATSIDGMSYFNASSLTSTKCMFYNMNALTSLDLSRFNTSNVTDMRWMFYCCNSLTSLNLGSNFYTSNIDSTYAMFYACKSLESLSLGSNFNTANVTSMQYMFSHCESLRDLELGTQFVTNNVTNMGLMFDSCYDLTAIDVAENATTKTPGFDTSKVTNFQAMFRNCESLVELDVSEFNTIAAKNMSLMFEGCSSLTFIDLSNFNTSSLDGTTGAFKWGDDTDCINVEGLFNGCTGLETIILGEDFAKLDSKYMFTDNSALKRLISKNNAADGIIPLSTDTYIGNYEDAVFYVIDSYIEADYEADATYISEFGEKRIQPMMTMLGEEQVKVFVGSEYVDAGVTIAGCAMDDIDWVLDSGFEFTTNLPISTQNVGTQVIYYTFQYVNSDTGEILGQEIRERTVEVTEMPKLMARETGYSGSSSNKYTYMLGAYRAGKTTYTADLVERIIFSTTVPEGYITDAVWDVSDINGKGEVVSYLVPSETTDGLYDQYIVADSTISAPKNSSFLFNKYKKMTTIVNAEQLSTSSVTNMDQMFTYVGYNATIFNLDLSNWDTSSVTDMYMMFGYTGYLASTYNLDLSNWDTSNVTNMGVMFSRAGYSATTWSIGDISNWDTSSVTNMSQMFTEAGYSVTTFNLDLNGWDTSSVTKMNQMFWKTGYSATTWSIGDISNWDTSNVIDMSYMFYYAGYTATTWSIGDISGWNTSNVTNMGAMFRHAGYNATTWSIGDLSGWGTSSVTNMSYMFYYAGYKATTWSIGDLSGWDTSSVTNMSEMFYSAGYNATTFNLDLSDWDTSKVTNMNSMFASAGHNATTWSIGDLSGWDTSSVTNMKSMFSSGGTNSTTWSIGDLSNWDTSKVTDMSTMFYYTSYRATTWSVGDLNNWDTSNVTDMSGMFGGVGRFNVRILELDLSNWDTSKVTDMSSMFQSTGANATTCSIGGLSNWDTSKVTDMSYMFSSFSGRADINSWDTSSVTNMNSTFSWCEIYNLDISGWNTAKVTNMRDMFYQCYNLKTLILGENFTKLNGANMFKGCSKLTRIISLRKSTSSGDIMAVSSDNYLGELSTRILYVPDKATEALYEADETYMSLLGSDRIQTIMSVAGSNPITVDGGSTYGETEDEGVTVLNWSESDKTNYNNLGFTTETSGLAVDTVTSADKTVTYKLFYNGSLVDTQTRTVKISAGNYLVGENYYQTLESAIASISGVGTITVVKDCTDDSEAIIPSSKNITLDLGYATVTKTGHFIQNYGTLTIKGNGVLQTAEFDRNDLMTLITNNNYLNIEDGILINKGFSSNYWKVITCLDNSTTNITGGTLKTTLTDGKTANHVARTISVHGSNAILNIEDGIIINENNAGCIIESYQENDDGSAIVNQNSKININSGDITNEWGNIIAINSQKNDTSVNITNGNIRATGYLIGINEANDTGDILISDGNLVSETNYVIKNDSTVNNVLITGGRLISNNATAVKSNSVNTTLGQKDSKLLVTTPLIQGGIYAVEATNGFNFYDGILKGATSAHSGTVKDVPNSCEVSYSDVVDEDVTYKMAALATYLMLRDYDISGNGIPNAAYVLGAERAGHTEYTSDKVESIVFENEPTADTSIVTWDISDVQNGGIVAWMVDNDSNGLYEMHIATPAKIKLYENGLEMLFADYVNCIEISNINKLDVDKITSLYGAFYNNKKIVELDVTGFDTSKVTTFESMFEGCSILTNVDVSGFDTNSAETLKAMFRGCELIDAPNMNGWNTKNVKDMSYMFDKCYTLNSIDLESLEFDNVTTIEGMFANCISLISMNLNDINSNKIENMSNLFNGCSNLAQVELNKIDVSNVKNVSAMFANCTLLLTLDLHNFDLSSLDGSYTISENGVDFADKNMMFSNCASLDTLLISEDFNGLDGINMFDGCTSLTAIITNDAATQPSKVISLSTNTGVNVISEAIFYVPDITSEATYEKDENYIEVFGTERIKPLLALNDSERVEFSLGGTYVEYGYTVADKELIQLSDENIKGYDVTITGVDSIDFSEMGIYEVTYTLTYTDPTVTNAMSTTLMSIIREIQIGSIQVDIYITGVNEYDSTLSVDTISSSVSEDNFTYQWYFNDTNDTETGTAINGATLKTYTIGEGLVGKYIYVKVTASLENYDDFVTYAITDEIYNNTSTVSQKIITTPKAEELFVYNGVTQTYTDDLYIEKYMSVTGNTGIDAGDYTATFSLKLPADCEWDTTSETNVDVIWTITPKAIAVIWDGPFEFTYNCAEQGPELHGITSVDGETAILTRSVYTDVGTYLSTATLTAISGGRDNVANYTLINDTHSFEITKATPTFKVTPKNLSLTGGNTGILNYESSIESTVTAVSDNEAVASIGSISSEDKTIEVVSNGVGSTTLSITLNETSNYNSVTVTVTVGTMDAKYTDGDNYYETLYEALNGVEDNGTVIVLKDVTETTAAELESGKNVILKINAYTITANINNFITVNGQLTIDGEGTITVGSNIDNLVNIDNGTLNITSGVNLNGYNSTVSNNNGEFNMLGGNLTQNNSSSTSPVLYVNENATANIKGGIIKSADNGVAIQNTGVLKITNEVENPSIENVTGSKKLIINSGTGTAEIVAANLKGQIHNSSTNGITIENSTLSVNSEYAVSSSAGEVNLKDVTVTGTKLLNLSTSNADAKLSGVTATTTDVAIVTSDSSLDITDNSNIKSAKTVLETYGTVNIINSALETTNTSDDSTCAVNAKSGAIIVADGSNLVANVGKAILNEGNVSLKNDTNVSSLGDNTVLNMGIITFENSTLKNEKTTTGNALDNDGTAILTNTSVSSNGTVIDNSSDLTVNASTITSASGTALKTSGTAILDEGSEINGATGIENTGTLTFGAKDGVVLRDKVKVIAVGTAVQNANVFNWNDGEITGNAATIYSGNDPVVEDNVAIASEINGSNETRYVVRDMEKPVIKELISETDWVKNSQTIQVVAEDNIRIEGYALTQTNVEPAIDSNVWTSGNTFIVNENKTYYIWVKDNAGNIVGKEFIAKWICLEIWDTTGTTGSDTRAVLHVDGKLVFEVKDRTLGTNANATGVIKDYTVSNAEWSDDARITSVVVSEGITAIGNYGLSNMIAANSVTIPASVVTMSESAMYKTNNYSTLSVSGGNSNFISDGLAVYDIEKTVLYSYSSKSAETSFVMPDTVKNIVTGLFYNNKSLTEIRTSKNIISVGEDAFEFVTGDVYYYTSSYEMKVYATNNDTEANFIPIDDVKPEITSFVINNNEAAATTTGVTLMLTADDDVSVSSMFASETYYTDTEISQLDSSYWTTYSGTEYPFTLTSNPGTKRVYAWVKDANGNVSEVAEDIIYYGDIAFELYGQQETVQYVDKTGKDYYKYIEAVQGGTTEIENITIDTVGSVNHRVVGTYSINYGITIDGTLMQSKTRTVDVIENTWTGATGVTDGGYEYVIHTSGKYAKITKYTASVSQTLTIPGTITHNGTEYKVIDVGSVVENTNILGSTSNSVVKTVVLPDTLINIGENAFVGFTALENINIPFAVMSISSNALKNAGTTSGMNLALSDNFRELKSNALINSKVDSIVFGKGIRYVGENAFANVSVPSGFILEIPALLDAIGDGAFESTRIYDIKVDAENNKFMLDTSEMALLTNEGETLLLYPIDSDFEEYMVDEGVKTIGAKAFKDANKLKVINLSSTVANIEESAFRNATNLSNVVSSNVVTFIGEYAFANSGITSLELNNGIVSIEKGTFENTKLEFIRVPKNVLTIKEDAFKGIATLKNVVMECKPSLESNAFANCDNLEFMMLTNNNGIVSISDTTAIPDHAILYVPSSIESLYEGDSVYMTYSNYTDKIQPIIELVGEPEVVWLVNTPYVESGVELVGELLTAGGDSTKVSGLELVVEGVVNTSKSERTVISYIAEYNGIEVNRVERIVDVEDTEAPVIVNVTTDSDWVAPKQTFVVEATDNIGVTHYIITETNAIPSIDDSRWQTSNSLKVASNGSWYIFVKDSAGNISERKQVTSTWVAAAKWDVSKLQNNTIHAIVSLDGTELIIKGVGETKDYSTNETPWNTSYKNTINTITVENGVTSIGNHLFGNLPNVLTINLSSTVSKVVDGAFAHTNQFTAVNLNGNTYLEYSEGTLYNSDKTELYVHTIVYTQDYSLPTSVTKICEAAFANSIYISKLDLTNVTEIQSEAFKGCTHLTEQYVPKTLERIGENVFAGTRGPVYYYSSCDTMMDYVSAYGTETVFKEIDDIKPVIKNFTINNNEAITKDPNVTLQIEATDNKNIVKILLETSQSTNVTSSDSRWIDYTGESEISYSFTNENGIRTLYAWIMDDSGNVSNVASDVIVLGENDFAFEYNDDIVQYVDKTAGNYYKFDEEVQGKYFVTTEGFTVSVNSNIDVRTVGEKQIVYTLSFNGTPAGEFYKNVDVIEDSWGTEVFVENGFSYVKHTSKNYAKIVKYTDSNAVTFPSIVTNGGVNYKVIEIESLDSNPVISTSATSVTLPNTIISIGKNAFVGCTSLITINLKENVMTIEENAFKNTGLRSLDLKQNVREVKESAFENTNITTFAHSKLLKSVETKAFGDALNITELSIPGTIDNIAEGAYAGSIIDIITIDNEMAGSDYKVYNNNLLVNNNTHTILQYATGSANSRFESDLIGIQKVGRGAFKNATNLTGIVIKNGYSQIGEESFRNTGLITFELPDSVTEVPEYAFADTESLEILVLNGVRNIKVNALENNAALKALVILTDTGSVSEIDEASKLNASTNVYVLSAASYQSSSDWFVVADRVYDVLRLNGDADVTTEAGFDYVEKGAYAIDTLFKTTSEYAVLENIDVEITGNVDTDILGEHEVVYKLKSNDTTKITIIRKVTVVDTIAPRIDSVNKLDEAQILRERFTVVASDNHKITGYAITKDSVQPALNSTSWGTSNVVYATENGTWYIWVKDEAGNVSVQSIEAKNICTEKWDIGVVADTVYAIITIDNKLVIDGIGEVKYFAPVNIPWVNYNEAIRKVEVGEGVTLLPRYILAYLKNVTEISLPSTLTSVATSTFMQTNNFTTLVFPNGTDTFVYEDYNLYSADRSILYVHSNKDTKTSYVMDENVKTIAEYAFTNNANIVEITTTSNPTLLSGAFSGAYTLQTISGDVGGTSIGSYAFENCSKLKDVKISEDIESVGAYAFSNCNMITEIEMIMCSNLTTLHHHAFANLNNLKELKVYRTISQITSDTSGIRNVFENMGSNFVENAKVYYFEGCTAMEQYAKLYPDANVDFILIDQLGPRVEKLTVTNQESDTYAAGTTLEIVATMTEEFVTYKGTIPSLSISFGNGSAIDLGVGEIDGKDLKYMYVIQPNDLGELRCPSFVGELYDSMDNRTEFNSPETFDKEIIARTGVILESDFEDTKYFTYLNAAAEYITVGGKITMLLDETTEETSIFKGNTLVSLDINGKKVAVNSETSKSLIINRGVLNITDSGAGALSILGTSSGDVTAILNEGILTVVNGIVRGQGSGDVTAFGVYNKADASLTLNGGSVEAINNTGISYAVVNEGELRMEGGNIQSSTIEGKTYALYNIGETNILNGQIAARISTGTKGEAIGVYIENGTFIVGNGDENINPDGPIIYSTKDGLQNKGGTLEFYDGFIEGQAYRSLSTDNVKVVPGYALVRKLTGTREKAMLDHDVVSPTIELKNLTPDWTKDSVTVEANFIDAESGIQSAEHAGEVLELVNNKITIEVFENKTLTFRATDFAGNVAEESITISNIDRVSPTFENLSYEALANDEEVTLTVTIKDDAAGVYGYSISKFDVEPNEWKKVDRMPLETNISTIITSNGKYYLYAKDDAGNIARYPSEINITNVDAYSPEIESLVIDDDGRGFANSSIVMINVKAEDDTGVKEILLSNTLLTNNQVLDSENWVPYTEEVIWELPIGDGEKTVYVWVKDRVGRISRPSTVTTKLLAQYIGNNGTNSTTFKFISKDENYNFDNELAKSNLYVKVKDSSGTTTYTGSYGSNITMDKAPIVYGPMQEGSLLMNGRYYFVETNNLQGNGLIYICIGDTAEIDKAGNKISSDKLEIDTDVIIELEAPYITIGSTQLSVYDTDAHVMNAVRINGQTIKLKNGVITKAELESTYGITLTSGTVIEAFDKCGNIRKQTV